jgi:hypothetical protein
VTGSVRGIAIVRADPITLTRCCAAPPPAQRGGGIFLGYPLVLPAR